MDKNKASFNWFPGHMAKAKRELEENIKLVDLIIELRDARMPLASFNESFKDLYKNKKTLTIYNKADLIDDNSKDLIKKRYSNDNILLIDSKASSTKKVVISKINELSKDKIEKNLRRGIRNTEIRVMVIGIPNVGKSTLINTISSKKSAKVENKPGVTRSLQWINIDKTIKLLDTPGILAPKLNSKKDALLLSLLGAINDEVIDIEACAEYACGYLWENNKEILISRYGIDSNKDFINNIGESKKVFKTNGEIDSLKTAKMIVNDVRDGKLGKLIWEKIDA